MFRRSRFILASATIATAIALPTFAAAADAVTLGEDPALLSGIPGKGPLKPGELKKWLDDDANHQELDVALPKGLDLAKANIHVPEDNPMTRAKVELGRQLYFDKRLSSDNTVSCASCHHPDKGFAFDTQFGVGVDGQEGDRNSPVSYNRIVSKAQFWDGRAESLEAQAVGPIANPIEMGNTHEQCVKTLASIPVYKKQFEKIFDDGVTIDNVGKAIATFERAIVTAPTKYDYYQPLDQFEKLFEDDLDDLDDGLLEKYEQLLADVEEHEMSESAVRGMRLFASKAKCAECHAGANFTDEQYHNLGVGMDAEEPDWGRFNVTKVDKDKGAFKTPTLRNIALSGPYMHDGSQKTLEEVVEWYNKGGHPNDWLSDKMKKLDLNDQEKKDLVAFMKEGLTSDFPEVNSARLPVGGKPNKAAVAANKNKKNQKAEGDDKEKAMAATDSEESSKLLKENPYVAPKDEAMAAKTADGKEKVDAKAAAQKDGDSETGKDKEMADKVAKSDARDAKTPPVVKPAAKSTERGYLGVTCDADNLSISRVARVKPDSAAMAAGLKEGDVIIRVNETKVGTFEELKAAMAGGKVGDELKLRIKRGDEKMTITATLKGLKN